MLLTLIAAVIATSPASFTVDAVKAPPGATLKLAPGTYEPAYFRGQGARNTPLTIDARDPGVVIKGLRWDGSSEVTIVGAHVVGGNIWFAYASHDMKTVKTLCTDSVVNCIQIGNSQNITIDDTEIIGSTGDGIDIGASQHVKIRRVGCEAAKPAPGAHPDCIQMYSFKARNGRPDEPALSYILIDHVLSVGNMQGVGAFGNEIMGDHIVIHDVHAATNMVWALAMDDACNACSIVDVSGFPLRAQFGVAFVRPHQVQVGSTSYSNVSGDVHEVDKP